jgi:plastocyanin
MVAAMWRACLLAICLVACGSDNKTVDSPTSSTVQTVDCASVTADATVTTSGSMYSPMATTVSVGQVVKFVMIAGSGHNVTSSTANLTDDFGMTACKKFTAAGTFSFMCSVHGFMGTVTVQ